MKKAILLVSIAVSLLFTSCLNVDDIQIVDVESFDFKSLSKIEVGVEVSNDSRHNIKIKSANLELFQRDKKIVDFIVNEEILIPRKTTGLIDIPIRIKVKQPLLVMQIISNIERYKTSLKISGEVSVKAGVLRKKFTLKDMPVSQFIDTFGADFLQ